jgi:hypothetical protein
LIKYPNLGLSSNLLELFPLEKEAVLIPKVPPINLEFCSVWVKAEKPKERRRLMIKMCFMMFRFRMRNKCMLQSKY